MFESLHFHRIEISFFEKGFRLYAFGFPALLISTYLDKLKDKDGNYILQKDPTQQTKGKMLFGEYPIIKLSKKTLASEKIMNTDGHTIDGYKHPIFCGDLKEAVTLFDRNVLTIDLNDKGAGLWDKDMTGIKVRDRFDVQPVDKGAVIKGQITEVING